jgi:signal peptidase I
MRALTQDRNHHASTVSAAAVLAVVAMIGVGSSRAALPSDAAGVPFVTFARAAAAGDYPLACEQIAVPLRLGTTTPGPTDVEAARTACVRALRTVVNGLDAGRRRSLATTRVVQVRLGGDRARVTVQTMLYGVTPRATGIAIRQDGRWKIAQPPSGAHVGGLLLYTMPSESMTPTLQVGDTLLINPAAYRQAAPRIGDIVAFHPPEGAFMDEASCGKRPPAGQACATATPHSDSTVTFVKRIVALPGDRFSMRNGHVIRNGTRAMENFIRPCGPDDLCDFARTFTVAAGTYYVVGDNRGRSEDSRHWGPIPAGWIVGRVRRLGP